MYIFKFTAFSHLLQPKNGTILRLKSEPLKAGVVCLHMHNNFLVYCLVTMCTRHFRMIMRIRSLSAVSCSLCMLTTLCAIGSKRMLVLDTIRVLVGVCQGSLALLSFGAFSVYLSPRLYHGEDSHCYQQHKSNNDADYGYHAFRVHVKNLARRGTVLRALVRMRPRS